MGQTQTSTATLALWCLERFPGRGYKTANVLVCLQTRSGVSLSLRGCTAGAGRPAPLARRASKQAAIPWSYTQSRRGRSCWAGGSRAPQSPVSGWRANYPPPLPGPAGRNLPSSCQTQKWRRALPARVARICRIVSSRNRVLYLLRAISALLSAFDLALQPLDVLPFVLSVNFLLDLHLKNLLYLCSLLLERFVEPWRRC